MRYSLTNPHEYIRSNITGFLNILEACRHHPVQHLVYASSSSVYGGNTRLPFKESDNVDHPVSLYAASKKSNELMAHTYSHLFGIPSTGLRFFTVYGPWGRPDMALFLFTKAILAGEPVNVFNHGKMQRDFTYIDDIVEGVVRVLDRAPQPNPAFDTDVTRPGALVGAVPGAQHRQPRAGGSAGVSGRARRSAGPEGGAELPADAAGRRAGDVCGYDAADRVDRAQARDADPGGNNDGSWTGTSNFPLRSELTRNTWLDQLSRRHTFTAHFAYRS